MNILVFRTNIRHKRHINLVTPHLDTIAGIRKWNVDLQDKDRILRIEALDVIPLTIERVLEQAGYYCKELED
ncbi:hypothetical protein EXU57_12105 [Segetibacter sp. 3557_3]|uniref:hypothetical protein n=1 Tax=Segetibacter sp. 3557_3 TaxID=2547429 RepID=UPI001058BE2D|nr:hypothetical protein [Segetibacter sp. 3557_3]TDH26225.1 hypothetical protein EXU57_12105 [Segetibacter sp. 3557_3]